MQATFRALLYTSTEEQLEEVLQALEADLGTVCSLLGSENRVDTAV